MHNEKRLILLISWNLNAILLGHVLDEIAIFVCGSSCPWIFDNVLKCMSSWSNIKAEIINLVNPSIVLGNYYQSLLIRILWDKVFDDFLL